MASSSQDSLSYIDASMLDITASRIYARRQLSPHRLSREHSRLDDDDEMVPVTPVSTHDEDEMSSAFREHFDAESRKLSAAYGIALPDHVSPEPTKPAQRSTRFREELDRDIPLDPALLASWLTDLPKPTFTADDAGSSSTTLAASLSTADGSRTTFVSSFSSLSKPAFGKKDNEHKHEHENEHEITNNCSTKPSGAKRFTRCVRRWVSALKACVCVGSHPVAREKTPATLRASTKSQAEINDIASRYEPTRIAVPRMQYAAAARERNYQRRFGWQNQTEI